MGKKLVKIKLHFNNIPCVCSFVCSYKSDPIQFNPVSTSIIMTYKDCHLDSVDMPALAFHHHPHTWSQDSVSDPSLKAHFHYGMWNDLQILNTLYNNLRHYYFSPPENVKPHEILPISKNIWCIPIDKGSNQRTYHELQISTKNPVLKTSVYLHNKSHNVTTILLMSEE